MNEVRMVEKVCSKCKGTFQTSNDSELCYNCTLADVAGDLAPEEGDFNTASILSGTMTAEERRWLQEDLEAV